MELDYNVVRLISAEPSKIATYKAIKRIYLEIRRKSSYGSNISS